MTGSRDVIKGLSPRQRRALLVVPIAVLVAFVAAVIVSRRRSAPARVVPLAPSAPPSSVLPRAAEPVIPTKRLPSRWTGNIRRLVPVAALVAAVLVVGLAQGQSEPAPVAGPAPASPMVSATPSPNSSNASSCSSQADEPFTPSRITVPGVVRDAPVLALPRDRNNVPGVPPATDAGRWEFGWDRPPGIRPGSAKGNVLLNAHTFPDGDALGNEFLDKLDTGDEIIVRGKDAELCYKVSKRIQVREADGNVAYYVREGPPQLALLVCSGKRLGPGEWTHRTIWFASPA